MQDNNPDQHLTDSVLNSSRSCKTHIIDDEVMFSDPTSAAYQRGIGQDFIDAGASKPTC
jgi:hypothetical protein